MAIHNARSAMRRGAAYVPQVRSVNRCVVTAHLAGHRGRLLLNAPVFRGDTGIRLGHVAAVAEVGHGRGQLHLEPREDEHLGDVTPELTELASTFHVDQSKSGRLSVTVRPR